MEMTTQKSTRKEMVGVLKAITEEEKGGKNVFTFQVLRDGTNDPAIITLWPDRDGNLENPGLTKGLRYRFVYDAKPTPSGRGEYRNYSSASLAEGSVAPKQGQQNGHQALQPSTTDPHRASIERQVALYAATSLAVALIGREAPFTGPESGVERVSDWWADWVREQVDKHYACLQGVKVNGMAPTPQQVEKQPETASIKPRDPAMLRTPGDFFNAVHEDYGWNKQQALAKIGKTQEQVTDWAEEYKKLEGK